MKKLLTVAVLLFCLVVLPADASKAQGQMQVGGQVGISLPIGDFGDAANLGFGFLGSFLYSVTPVIDLHGNIGYFTWGTDLDGADFSNVPVLVGGRYYFQKSNIAPYGLAELGINFATISVEVPSSFNPFTGEFTTTSVSDTETKVGLGLGGGVLVPLSPQLKLDANVKFNLISDLNNISIMAGVLYSLN